MYEVTVNGQHAGTGGTYLAARNVVLIPRLEELGLDNLLERVEFTGDADSMVDYMEWCDAQMNIAIIEYVEE